MQFVSTRGQSQPVSFLEALFTGYAPDGGMYLPHPIPSISSNTFQSWRQLSFPELVVQVISLYVDQSVITTEELRKLIHESFATFHTSQEAPQLCHCTELADGTVLCNLSQGPSMAFKDYGVAVLVGILDHVIKKQRQGIMNLVVATSGDTGPSAIQSVRRYPNSLKLFVLYPIGAVSKVQELQMISEVVGAPNVYVLGVEDSSSDALDSVLINVLAQRSQNLRIGTINSINIVRILVQSCFYIHVALKYWGEKIGVVTPSGALGSLSSGLLAARMGAPIHQFLAACNVNNSLGSLLSEGYFLKPKRSVVKTYSNAIDIVVPYNLWRVLYLTAADLNPALVRKWQDQYENEEKVQVVLANLQRFNICTETVDDQQTFATMQTVYREDHQAIDPHTAVGVHAARNSENDLKYVVLSTAHVCKFVDLAKSAIRDDVLKLTSSQLSDSFLQMLQVDRVHSQFFRFKDLSSCENKITDLLQFNSKL